MIRNAVKEVTFGPLASFGRLESFATKIRHSFISNIIHKPQYRLSYRFEKMTFQMTYSIDVECRSVLHTGPKSYNQPILLRPFSTLWVDSRLRIWESYATNWFQVWELDSNIQFVIMDHSNLPDPFPTKR